MSKISDAISADADNVGSAEPISALASVDLRAHIGRDCRVGPHSSVGAEVFLGDRVLLGAGVKLDGSVRIENDVRVGANSVIQDRSVTVEGILSGPVFIRSGAEIGSSVVIGGALTIGQHAQVCDGAVVTRSVPANAIVLGVPAQIVGYVGTNRSGGIPVHTGDRRGSVETTPVRGVSIHRMSRVHDLRGDLSVGEVNRDVPFEVKRYFLVYNVPSIEIRGEHAHLECHQFLIAVKGSVHVVVDDGVNRSEIVLNEPSVGVYLPPLTWGVQYRYTIDAVLLVLASHAYNAADYIRDHDEFVATVSKRGIPATE